MRHYITQATRQIIDFIPKQIRSIDADLIERFRRVQNITSQITKEHQRTENTHHEQQNEEESKFPKLRKIARIVALSLCASTTYKTCSELNKSLVPVVKAKVSDQGDDNTETNAAKRSDHRTSFSERTIIEYENRLRNYSAPEKIFRYFATICIVSDKGLEIVMTPTDFLRSIYPGKKQPVHLGLDRFRRIDRKDIEDKVDLQLDENSVFLKLGFMGLINFADYLFLMTVLTTSSRHFEIAFQMFDINGDGVLVAQEFEAVAALSRQKATFAATQYDMHRKGVTLSLMRYFFGADLKGKLSISDFLKFQRDLKTEVLNLEFDSKPTNEKGVINESDFAELLIAYAGYSVKEKEQKLKRVRKRFKNNARGISRQDYLDFWHFLNNLEDVEIALSFYHMAGASIDKATLHHVAKAVVSRQLSEHAVDVAFAIFDENNDDHLSKKEFVSVMKRRLYRGMEWKRGTNFMTILQALKKCAFEKRHYDV